MTQLTLVCLGDSTTAGTPGFFSPRERPPHGQGDEKSQYAYWIQKENPDWKILNRGVRGQRTDQLLRRYDYDVTANHPDILIVLGGVNDLHQGREADAVKANLLKIYEKSAAENIKVMACSILPLDLLDQAAKMKILEINQWIKKTAAGINLGFCDTYQVLEDPSRPGFLLSTPDDIHPDVEGHRLMGLALSKAVRGQLL